MRFLSSKVSVFSLLLLFAACGPVDEPGGLLQATGGTGSGAGGLNGSGGLTENGGSTGGTLSNPAGGSNTGATGGTESLSGGSNSGGSASGGVGSSTGGADSGVTCPLPDTFEWTSTGPIAQPKSGWVSLKDFTSVRHDGKIIVYLTNHDTQTTWGAAMFQFDAWSGAATAEQPALSFTAVAPTLFYFAPKEIWVLAYQWGGPKFSYTTSSDPTNPASWATSQTLFDREISNSDTGPIDQTVICDTTDCYLFFAGDNGNIYRSSMPIGDFPSEFGAQTTIMTDTTNNLFEAVQVYALKGSDKYLMIVESIGSGGRYFRSYTATDLGGEFTPHLTNENQPFAGKANVTFTGGAWTNDISHGDFLRDNPDQTFTIDPCHLEFLYQGRDPEIDTDYGRLPYRPAVLTLNP